MILIPVVWVVQLFVVHVHTLAGPFSFKNIHFTSSTMERTVIAFDRFRARN